MKLLKTLASTTEFCTGGCTGLLWFPLCQVIIPGAFTLWMTAGNNPQRLKMVRRLKIVKIKKKIGKW